MTTDNVATKTTGRLHGFFKINRIPCTNLEKEVRRTVSLETSTTKTIAIADDRGKTNATDADTVTYFYIIEIHFIGRNHGAQITAGFLQAVYIPVSFDYSGKHGFYFC